MVAWCMDHPWMTFFIIVIGINVVGNVVIAIARRP